MYELPFAAGSFDAVFAQNVLEHLREPVTALKEMWRVLRPGGVVGIRDYDWTAYLLEPMSPLKKLGIELILRVVEHNGGSFRSARFHARRLREAGLVGVQDHASLHDIAAEFRGWGESPDCYLPCFKCAATGRRPD